MMSPSPPLLSSVSPSSTLAASDSLSDHKDLNHPFPIREELLTPSRLAPQTQLLHHTRSVAVQVIAHEVFLLVLACTKYLTETNQSPPQVGVCGGGTVGTTVIMTLLANGYCSDRIALSTRQRDHNPRCEALRASSALRRYQSVPRYYDNARLARESDVVVLCMPPSQLKSVAIQIRHALAATEPLVISVLCGVTHHSVSKACGSQAIVRVQPDVAKIASQWREAQGLASQAQRLDRLSLTRATDPPTQAERDLQPLIQLAAEAIAPQQDDVRNLLQAFYRFCCRRWRHDGRVALLGHILFGDKSARVLTALDEATVDANGKQMHYIEVGTSFKGPLWSVKWDHALMELQEQLVAHALQHSA